MAGALAIRLSTSVSRDDARLSLNPRTTTREELRPVLITSTEGASVRWSEAVSTVLDASRCASKTVTDAGLSRSFCGRREAVTVSGFIRYAPGVSRMGGKFKSPDWGIHLTGARV